MLTCNDRSIILKGQCHISKHNMHDILEQKCATLETTYRLGASKINLVIPHFGQSGHSVSQSQDGEEIHHLNPVPSLLLP